MPHYGRVSLIEASPNDAGTAYAAVKNYQMDDRAPYIYRTHDYGKTWTKIVSGIAADDYVHAVCEDTVRKGLLFAGTEHGIYVSFDDGDTWQSIRLNLPNVQVSDIVIAGNDVVIATHGRSFHVLDDITPMRQLTPTLTSEAAHLFHSTAAQRNVSQARIDYYLSKPAQKVVVEIVDTNGQVVRSFTGTPNDQAGRGGRGGRAGRGGAAASDAPAAEDAGASDDPFAGGGGRGGRGGGNPVAPDKAGLNRFQWDMRYPGAKTFNGMIFWGANTQGPEAVPGTYTIRLNVDGQTYTDKIQLEKDPRLDNITVADLKEQFDLALKVRDEVTACNEMVIEIREFKKQIDDRLKGSNDAALKSALDAFRARLSGVEEDLYQVRNQSGQDPLNFPIKLNNKIAALDSSIEHGDGKPTAASYEVYDLLTKRLQEQQAKLDAIVKADLPRVNKMLSDKKLNPLTQTTTETAEPKPEGN
jgi:putative sterol carrier protein